MEAIHLDELKIIYGEQNSKDIISTLYGSGSQESTVTTSVTTSESATESTTESETSASTSETTVETAPKWMPVSQMQDETVFAFSYETYRKPKLDCTYGSFIIEIPANDRVRITIRTTETVSTSSRFIAEPPGSTISGPRPQGAGMTPRSRRTSQGARSR